MQPQLVDIRGEDKLGEVVLFKSGFNSEHCERKKASSQINTLFFN